jgi:hypothetical protein
LDCLERQIEAYLIPLLRPVIINMNGCPSYIQMVEPEGWDGFILWFLSCAPWMPPGKLLFG